MLCFLFVSFFIWFDLVCLVCNFVCFDVCLFGLVVCLLFCYHAELYSGSLISGSDVSTQTQLVSTFARAGVREI